MATKEIAEGNATTTPIALPAEKKKNHREPRTLKEVAPLGIVMLIVLVGFFTSPYLITWMDQHKEEYEPSMYNFLFFYMMVVADVKFIFNIYKLINSETPAPEFPPSPLESTFSTPPHPHLSARIAAERFFR